MLVGGNETIDVVLTNVLHVLGLAKHLFFVTKTTSLGRIFEFGKKKCHNEQTKESSWIWFKRKWSISTIA
jgi:hypothetical protein